MLVDLHTHSTESDGSLSPKELAERAKSNGLKAIALCDHDTTIGGKVFEEACRNLGIVGIRGVEISATWESGHCHIVGLGVASNYEPLEEALRQIRDSRGGRNELIIAKLQSMGIDITLEEVTKLAGGEVVGRPHMARIMLSKGYVTDIKDAFNRYLAKEAPAYVDRYHLPPSDAVRLLREAGALVVMAHPLQLKLDVQGIDALAKDLVPHGLGGIEVYTPCASDKDIQSFQKIAEKYSLAISGGSDFHGDSKPDHLLGYYRPKVQIPESCFDLIANRIVSQQS